MSSNSIQIQNSKIVPKAPKPKNNKIPKKISYINLIEIDDDESDSEESHHLDNNSNSSLKKEKCKYDGYFSDDRYEDSFDEEFMESKTNPDSGNIKNN